MTYSALTKGDSAKEFLEHHVIMITREEMSVGFWPRNTVKVLKGYWIPKEQYEDEGGLFGNLVRLQPGPEEQDGANPGGEDEAHSGGEDGMNFGGGDETNCPTS
jgi:hypothetical protein